MNDADSQGLETRVLVLAPTVKDAELTRAILARAGIACVTCPDQVQMCEQLTAGAGAMLIAEEAALGGDGGLAEWLERQPPWSDLPVLVLARTGADSPAVARAMNAFGNVTIVERTARVAALVSAVRSALRARRRQYQLRDQLVQRERVAEQLNMAMAAAQAGSWQVDLATGEFSASDRAIKLHGLPPGTQLNHERALACVHPDDRVRIEEALRLTLESGQPFRQEYRVPQPDGSVRWMSSQAERRGASGQTCIIGLAQDVTDRKQAEEALRASEDRFRLAADAVNGIIYEWDILTGHVERQRGLYEIVGYRPDEVPPTAAWWLEQVHPDDREPARRQFEEAAACGNSVVAECRVRHRDGRWLHVEDRGVLQRGDDGQPIKMVGCTVDVTAQKQADAERRRRETFTSGILGSITDGFGVVCKDWRFTFANDEIARRFGKQRDEILGSAMWEMLPHAVGNHAYVQLHRAMADRVAIEYEVYYEPWQRWFLDKAFPTADGGLAVYSRDITDRKQTADQLRQGEARFRAGIEAVSDIVWTNDAQGMMAGEQVGWGNFTGQDRESYQGYGWSRAIHPDDAQPTVDAWNESVAGKKNFTFEHRVRRSDGEWRLCTVRAVPVLDRQGEISEWVGVHTDITDRKRAERLEDAQRRVLELVATDASLPDVLAAVCRVVEDEDPGLACSLLLPDAQGRHTGLAVGASLPDTYLRGLEGLRIDPPYIGSCSQALDCGEVVFATNVEADELFAPEWRALLLGHGLRACRSIPVLSPDGTVLASFAVYRREPGNPEPANKQLVQVATSLTGIAIQRLQSQQSLRTSAERLRLAINVAGMGILSIDYASDTSTPDDTAAALFGLEPELAVPRSHVHDRFHPDDRDEIVQRIQQCLDPTGDGSLEMEHRVIHPDGTTRWLNVQKQIVFGDVAGIRRPVSGVLAAVDITASRHAQETVRASDARNSFLVTLTDTLRPLSDPITIQAEASRVLGERLGANRVAYFEIRGNDHVIERDYTNAAPSIVGCHPIASFGPDPLAALRAGRTASETDVDALHALTPEEKAVFASLQIRAFIGVPLVKDGKLVAGLGVHAASVRAWTPTEIAMAEDTAERTWAAVERVRAEAALRTSEVQRRLALDAAELGTWHVDVATRATKTDERFRSIFGTTEEWTDYQNLFAVMHPDDLPAVERAVASATRPDDPAPYAIEYRVVHPDGALRWVFAKGGTTHEEKAGRSVVSFNGTVMDITARKLIEQERERLVSQLRDADRRKDEFLATLAHELRNPLAPLRNGLQVIRLAGANGTVEQARAMMDRQLTQLVRLVDDLMDVSRVTSGKLELRKGRVALRTVIDAAVETSRPDIEQAGHELVVVVPDEPIFVDADAARLAQVVSNLLNNSAKYTQRGGHVRLTAWREDGTAVVSVKDDGIGIPPAMLGRVFEMFTQVDRALEKTTGGLGIGLSLVKGLLEMHGGTIEARSDGEGTGSELVLRLPLVMSVVTGPDRPNGRTSEVVPSALRRILVVDDNVDAADSLGQLLEMLGNEVRTANDGEAGIAVAAQFRPDVVLMDIGMPKLNGYEAARRIRQQPWGRAMVLVALTGWGLESDRKKSADAGFDHHLVKPVEMDALTKLMSSLKCADVLDDGASAAALPSAASPWTDPRTHCQPL